jgi:membrane protease YdiL (CAAX protease family)
VENLAALSAEGGSVRLEADSEVALEKEGPFERLAVAILDNAALRDRLARAFPIPSLRGYERLRLGLAVATAAPMAMLVELDSKALVQGATAQHGAPARLFIDLLLVAAVVFELSRRTPRVPAIAASALTAISLRWGLAGAKLCGGDHAAHPLVYVAAVVALVAALVLLVRVPSRSRVALELLGKLGITRSAFLAQTTADPPPGAAVAAAIGCAAGLPALLSMSRAVRADLWAQAVGAVAYAAVAPRLMRRFDHRFTPERVGSFGPGLVVLGAVTGLALTAAVVTAGRLFFDTSAEVARCFQRLDVETRTARAAESVELARAVQHVRGSGMLIFLTAALSPFAEERIYRAVLQDVLVRKYGVSYGVLAASIAFGAAHVGIYDVALYQTVLLGIGFGVAYSFGGFYAAFLVHATWNLLQLL